MAELKRTLGFWKTSAFTFLNLVNTGIFFALAITAAIAGADSLIAIALLGVMSIYTAMCFAELTTMFPQAGGVYEFAKRAYGRFVSFEIGWIVWLINVIAIALLVVAAVEYLLPPSAIAWMPFDPVLSQTLFAIGIIVLLNLVALRGADESAKLMLTLAIFTVLLLALLLIPGLTQLHLSQFGSFPFQWTAILLAAFVLTETFFGWESISFMAEEVIEPERTIPRALIWTTAFAALASVAVAAVTMGLLSIEALASGEIVRPIVNVLETLQFPPWLVLVANLGIVVTFLGNAAGSVIGNPRLLMALARDKLFIEQFSDIHPKYQTPYRGIIFQTIVSVLIVVLASGAYEPLLEMVVAPSILLYAAVLFLVPYFRWRMPKHERPYRTPMGSFLPLALVVIYLVLLLAWLGFDPFMGTFALNPGALGQLRLLGSFILFSMPIYLALLYFYDPDHLISTIDSFALLNLWLENFLVPKRVRREVLELLHEGKDKHILEFGSGVGSLTLHLAEHVGKKGKVYALDLSERNVRLLARRIDRLGHTHVEVIHDPHLVNRVHPNVRSVDMVVSIGNISYIQDVGKVLREMHGLLPHNGKICFVEYIDFFYFLPNNPKWLSDPEEVTSIFRKAGFSVRVEVKRGFFWKYLFIYGIKGSDVPYI